MKKMKTILQLSLILALATGFTACSSGGVDNATPRSADANGFVGGNDNGGGPTGTGGSMATFTITHNNLYVVQGGELHIYGVGATEVPQYKQSVTVSGGVETIFPFEDFLFLGTQNGMHIYSLANADFPELVSTYRHITSCDPVVTNGKTAFVTLRTGSTCGGGTNQLDVVDVQNLNSPFLIDSYPLEHPHGLSLDENLLFVCNGSHGLDVLNVADPGNVQEIGHVSGFDTYDVIARDGVMVVVGPSGIFQFDYANPTNPELLSSIPVVQ